MLSVLMATYTITDRRHLSDVVPSVKRRRRILVRLLATNEFLVKQLPSVSYLYMRPLSVDASPQIDIDSKYIVLPSLGIAVLLFPPSFASDYFARRSQRKNTITG